MNWRDIMDRLTGRKASAAGISIAAYQVGQPVWTPRRYDRLSEEGYAKNVVAFRCVREIARGAASVPWLLYRRDEELTEHPLLALLRRPNPLAGGAALFEAFFAYYQLAGNSYFEAVRPADRKPPRELHVLRPDRTRVVPGPLGLPQAYEYTADGRSVRWPSDPLTGASDILHFKDFNPLDDWYGMSPIEAAAYAIDQFNAAGEHNAALLQNGARPSGALVYKGSLTDDQGRRIHQMLMDRYQNPRNAGRPMVLSGDARWVEMALSPKDMDFVETKMSTARDICAAFGVPHVLVVPGEATFNNRADARLELWEQTIIPLLDRAVDGLNNWLVPMFGPGLRLAYDLDGVTALTPRRRDRYEQVVRAFGAGLLTSNEAREALDYAPLDGGDELPSRGRKRA